MTTPAVREMVLPAFMAVAGAVVALRSALRLDNGLHQLFRIAVPVRLRLFAVRSAVELWSDATGIL